MDPIASQALAYFGIAFITSLFWLALTKQLIQSLVVGLFWPIALVIAALGFVILIAVTIKVIFWSLVIGSLFIATYIPLSVLFAMVGERYTPITWIRDFAKREVW